MAKLTSPLLPKTLDLLAKLGERLRLARLRRQLQSKQVAERAGMSVITLRKIERGDPGVTMGAYLNVLYVLQMQDDLSLVAQEDQLGRRIQDAKLEPGRGRRSAKSPKEAEERDMLLSPISVREQASPYEAVAADASGKGGLQSVSTDDLLKLLVVPRQHRPGE